MKSYADDRVEALPLDAVGDGQNVSVANEDSAAELVRSVAEESGHPRPFAFIRRGSSLNPVQLLLMNSALCNKIHCSSASSI